VLGVRVVDSPLIIRSGAIILEYWTGSAVLRDMVTAIVVVVVVVVAVVVVEMVLVM